MATVMWYLIAADLVPSDQERTTRGPWNPGHPAASRAIAIPQHKNPDPEHGTEIIQRQPSTPMKDQG
jgi:hypothetical protein